MEGLFALSVIYSFFLTMPILVRLVLFNFFYKDKKRPLSMLMDAIVFISTALWLIGIRDVAFPLPSLTSKFAFFIFILTAADFYYNFIRFKKGA
ncbi:hypothetical protein ACZ11_10590 [Lysinibacillus xylanilyticus]|uniref:Uncharacterized protein n=1 Tax=Lysinibacillus xylanilyticus TaxID=582475 RepID=A0A0K9FDK7_9BACI|nr:hypothetical protein [Lysinibacillus xylanilyticus]KMY32555.1 hypothetical protein ACZ11_10590 [Lysinibacillus xylanilyticus]